MFWWTIYSGIYETRSSVELLVFWLIRKCAVSGCGSIEVGLYWPIVGELVDSHGIIIIFNADENLKLPQISIFIRNCKRQECVTLIVSF